MEEREGTEEVAVFEASRATAEKDEGFEEATAANSAPVA